MQHYKDQKASPVKQATMPGYRPDGMQRVKEVKQEMDAVLDNLKGLVGHVVQREEMKIR